MRFGVVGLSLNKKNPEQQKIVNFLFEASMSLTISPVAKEVPEDEGNMERRSPCGER
jgi:hypothetical protein